MGHDIFGILRSFGHMTRLAIIGADHHVDVVTVERDDELRRDQPGLLQGQQVEAVVPKMAVHDVVAPRLPGGCQRRAAVR